MLGSQQLDPKTIEIFVLAPLICHVRHAGVRRMPVQPPARSKIILEFCHTCPILCHAP